MRESKFALRDAWKATDPHSPALRDEHVRRVERLATFRREQDSLEQQRSANEHMLANQEAAYAQRELCTFIRKTAYAFTPRTIARAMAGLPDIGASQSYRRCSQCPEGAHTWPTSRYRIFRIIEQAWRDRSDRLKTTFLARLQKRARAIRGIDDDGMTNLASGVARQFFFRTGGTSNRRSMRSISRASIEMLCHSPSPAISIDVWRKRHLLPACSPLLQN